MDATFHHNWWDFGDSKGVSPSIVRHGYILHMRINIRKVNYQQGDLLRALLRVLRENAITGVTAHYSSH
jgi:hypothetical protein